MALQCVTIDGCDGQHLHLPPLVALEGHEESHCIIHTCVSVYDQLLHHGLLKISLVSVL